MTKNEQVAYELLQDFREGRKSRRQVALLLNISERAVSRRAAKLRDQGMSGIKHGNYQRRPHNKLGEDLRDQIMKLMKSTYYDFNVSHALEKLRENHQIEISYMTLLGWCKSEGLGQRRRRRPSKARLYRERMANEGILLQMDGSHHKWNGKEEWCLISVIDDATSNIPAGQFFNGETTWNCMALLKRLFAERGIPQFLYTDGAGWAGGSKRQGFSQVVAACEELGIKIIKANSPQAKGRIERSYRTLQDRLVAEMRLAGVITMTDANRYLDQVFWPQWNTRFTVEPQSSVSRYRPLQPSEDLGEILCIKHKRVVRNDHTVYYDNKRYKIDPKGFGNLRKKEVDIHEYEDKTFRVFYAATPLEHTEIIIPKRRWVSSDRQRRRFRS